MAANTEGNRPAWWGEGLVIVFLLVGYDRIADLERARVATAESDAAGLLRLERFLQLDVEGALNHIAAASRVLDEILSLYYDLAHGLVTVTVSVLVLGWLGQPSGQRQRREAAKPVAAQVALSRQRRQRGVEVPAAASASTGWRGSSRPSAGQRSQRRRAREVQPVEMAEQTITAVRYLDRE